MTDTFTRDLFRWLNRDTATALMDQIPQAGATVDRAFAALLSALQAREEAISKLATVPSIALDPQIDRDWRLQIQHNISDSAPIIAAASSAGLHDYLGLKGVPDRGKSVEGHDRALYNLPSERLAGL